VLLAGKKLGDFGCFWLLCAGLNYLYRTTRKYHTKALEKVPLKSSLESTESLESTTRKLEQKLEIKKRKSWNSKKRSKS